MKSSILSFKEETIKAILSAVPALAESQAERLIKRGDLTTGAVGHLF